MYSIYDIASNQLRNCKRFWFCHHACFSFDTSFHSTKSVKRSTTDQTAACLQFLFSRSTVDRLQGINNLNGWLVAADSCCFSLISRFIEWENFAVTLIFPFLVCCQN